MAPALNHTSDARQDDLGVTIAPLGQRIAQKSGHRLTVLNHGRTLGKSEAGEVIPGPVVGVALGEISFSGPSLADSGSALDVLPGSTRRSIAREYYLPSAALAIPSERIPYPFVEGFITPVAACVAALKLLGRLAFTLQGFKSSGKIDVSHATQHGDIECPSLATQSTIKFGIGKEHQV